MAKIENKTLMTDSSSQESGRRGTRFSVLIILIIALGYLVITIFQFSKINRALDEADKGRINYEKLNTRLEKMYEMHTKQKH